MDDELTEMRQTSLPSTSSLAQSTSTDRRWRSADRWPQRTQPVWNHNTRHHCSMSNWFRSNKTSQVCPPASSGENILVAEATVPCQYHADSDPVSQQERCRMQTCACSHPQPQPPRHSGWNQSINGQETAVLHAKRCIQNFLTKRYLLALTLQFLCIFYVFLPASAKSSLLHVPLEASAMVQRSPPEI